MPLATKEIQDCPRCPECTITTLLHYLVWLSLLSVQKKKPRVMAAIAIINSIVPILIFILLLVYNICTQLRGILQTMQFLRHKSKHFPWTSQTFRQKSFRFLQNFKSQHRSNRLHCYKCDKKRQAPKPRCLSPWLWFYFTLSTFSVKVSTDLVKDVNLFRIACQPYQENYRDHIISVLAWQGLTPIKP